VIVTEVAAAPRWDVAPAEARRIQDELRMRVVRSGGPRRVRHVAGIDASYDARANLARGAVVVLAFPGLEYVAHAIAELPLTFPYVPGLLSFRECPVALAALGKLEVTPDLLICDGQGYAHPRRFGLACHLGVLTGIPTIGAAKTRLIGAHAPVPRRKGSSVPLLDGREQIGAALRTRTGVAPLYVSVGHRIGLPLALKYVMACVARYRLPETTRWAHRLVSQRGRVTALPAVRPASAAEYLAGPR
jgi:deoxyribonuclease V